MKLYWSVIFLLSAGALAGCLSDDGSTDLPTDGERGEEENPNGNMTDRIIQESTTQWLTGIEQCADSGPSNIGTTDGVDHGIINMDGESLANAFYATIESEVAADSWAILFWAFPNEVVGSYESDGDTIEGTVPEEPSMAVIHACAGLSHEVEFTVTATEESD